MKYLKLGSLIIGFILILYSIYQTFTIYSLLNVYKNLNAPLPQNPYLTPILAGIGGVVLVIIGFFLRKRA